MKNFFEYDVNNPREHQERYHDYPELSKFYIALSEELPQDEYEKLYEAEKQSFFSLNQHAATSKTNQWIR